VLGREAELEALQTADDTGVDAGRAGAVELFEFEMMVVGETVVAGAGAVVAVDAAAGKEADARLRSEGGRPTALAWVVAGAVLAVC
jgi:hypothetical protein